MIRLTKVLKLPYNKRNELYIFKGTTPIHA